MDVLKVVEGLSLRHRLQLILLLVVEDNSSHRLVVESRLAGDSELFLALAQTLR